MLQEWLDLDSTASWEILINALHALDDDVTTSTKSLLVKLV